MDTLNKICNKKLLPKPKQVTYPKIVEDAISKLQNALADEFDINPYLIRWISLKVIDGDSKILYSIENNLGIDLLENEAVQKARNEALSLLKEHRIDINNWKDCIVSTIMHKAEDICKKVCTFENENYSNRSHKIDKLLTSKKTGIPIMLLFLGFIFWLTIVGSNYPSQALFSFFAYIQEKLFWLANMLNCPEWLSSLLISGVYQTLTWIVAVMLPPMAIFFPLFTILEDLGYLPRIAFMMDGFFKKCCCTR